MKKLTYVSPELQTIELCSEQSLLTASSIFDSTDNTETFLEGTEDYL